MTGTAGQGGASPAVDMATSLAWAPLPHPVLTASGCAAAGRELDQFFDIAGIGAIVTKSIMLHPRSGRATPRMAETPSGMLNSIGLQGPGIEAFLAEDLPWLRDRGARAVVSIAGETVGEYTELAQRLRHEEGITALEVWVAVITAPASGRRRGAAGRRPARSGWGRPGCPAAPCPRRPSGRCGRRTRGRPGRTGSSG